MSADEMPNDEMEDVESFRQRARTWIRDNLQPASPGVLSIRRHMGEEEELAAVAHDRALQRRFFDAGFAGICWPQAYGGQGLTPAHQRALNEELGGYEFPSRLQVPTLSPCGTVLLEFGTEDQKRRHIPAMLRGEEIWMQLLSEPSGGSDVAAALTTAVRDGDEWVLNGSKIWTTGAWWADWGLCLARTNWDVPKHRGLSVFIFRLDQPGVEVHRIEMLNGSKEFCQEYMTDVRVPDTDRIGEVDQGWTVGTRWMFHERMLYNSPYVTFPSGTIQGGGVDANSLVRVARTTGRINDPAMREQIGEVRTLDVVKEMLQRRVHAGVASGRMPDQAAAIGRLFHGTSTVRKLTVAFELTGTAGAAWTDDDDEAAGLGLDFVLRQVAAIGGGTTEMARNVISERVLGMPRERSFDRDVAFREVPRGPTARP